MPRRKVFSAQVLAAASIANRTQLLVEPDHRHQATNSTQQQVVNARIEPLFIQIDQPLDNNPVDDHYNEDLDDDDWEDIEVVEVVEDKVSVQYERLAVADEATMIQARLDIERAILIRMFPSLQRDCQTCHIDKAEVYCRTCDLSHCISCCERNHHNLFCHDLQKYDEDKGLTRFTLPIKRLSQCSPNCAIPITDSTIVLVDLKGTFITIV